MVIKLIVYPNQIYYICIYKKKEKDATADNNGKQIESLYTSKLLYKIINNLVSFKEIFPLTF